MCGYSAACSIRGSRVSRCFTTSVSPRSLFCMGMYTSTALLRNGKHDAAFAGNRVAAPRGAIRKPRLKAWAKARRERKGPTGRDLSSLE
jgi:hypothetical protein